MTPAFDVLTQLSLCLALFAGAEDEAPSVDELKSALLRSRQELKSGRIELSISGRRLGHDGGERKRQHSTIVEFEGDRLRIKSHQQSASCDLAKSSDQYIFHYTDKPKNGGQFVANMGKVGDRRFQDRRSHFFDPRLIGLFCSSVGLLYSHELESSIMWRDEEGATVSRDELDGQSVWKIEAQALNGSTRLTWISPEKGYSVVRSEIQPGGGTYCVLEAEPHRYDGGWFPRRVIRQTMVADKLADEEIVTVESAEFNIEIDDKQFTIESFGLSPGSAVTVSDELESNIWDGEKLLPRFSKREILDIANVPEVEDRSRILWLINSVIFAAIAGITLRIYLRSKQNFPPGE